MKKINPDVFIDGSAPSKRIAATGSVIAAMLASSCCIAPLVLVTLGASGAWIGSLSALEPYTPWFTAITLMFLGSGFWQVYKKKPDCDEETYCANPMSDRLIKMTLWSATVLVVLVLTIDYWAPIFY
jgi:mercuric ion transport protein